MPEPAPMETYDPTCRRSGPGTGRRRPGHLASHLARACGRWLGAALALAALSFGPAANAASTVDQLVKARLSGTGSGFINAFGGKAAKDGLPTRTAVDGDRRAMQTGKQVEVIDLGDETIWRYSVNRKGKAKKCVPMSFEEFREQLAAMEQLPFLGGGEPADDAAQPEDDQRLDYELTINFTETGEQETHAGLTGTVYRFEAIAHRPELPVEEGGGVLEATFVVGPETAASAEMRQWNEAWAEQIGIMSGIGRGLHKVLLNSPALQEVMGEMRAKRDDLEGTILRVSTRLSVVPDPRAQEQAAGKDDDAEEVPTTLGGLGAKLGGAFIKKQQAKQASGGPQELYRSEVLTTGISEAVDPLLTLPATCSE